MPQAGLSFKGISQIIFMKKIKREKPYKKRGFPFGIFLMLFTVEFIIGSAAVIFYLRTSTINTINEVEKYTTGYSLTLAEAFAETAAHSYRARNYSALISLFREKISENLIDEAFFVLNDGRLIAHSSGDREKELEGNIATDGMSYNVDLILLPAREKKERALISNYNIIEKTPPFTREQRKYISEYIYKDINITGWLVSRAVFVRDKPVGTVNLIISRERIHDVIYSHVDALQRWILIVLAVSFGVSLVVSVIVFIRQRSIENRALLYSGAASGVYSREEDILIDLESSYDMSDSTGFPAGSAKEDVPAAPEEKEDPITIEILADFDPEANGKDESEFQEVDRLVSPRIKSAPAGQRIDAKDRTFRGGYEKAAGDRRIIRDAVPVNVSEMNIDTD